jgi:hypothetical protein
LFVFALVLTMLGGTTQDSSAAQTIFKPEHSGAAGQKTKKKKKPAPAKQAQPQKPKEPWELPMTVVIVRQPGSRCEPVCQEWIVAQGGITAATPRLFRKVLKALDGRKLPVLLDSPGGSVEAALEIGRMIRKADLDVAVASIKFEGCTPNDKACRLPETDGGMYRGYPNLPQSGFCASACPLILAAGRKRIASNAAYVGVHQIKTVWTQENIRYRETYRVVNGKKRLVSRKVVTRKTTSRVTYGLDKRLRKQLGPYLDAMGVSRDLLTDMEKAPHSSIYWLSAMRSRELALLTNSISELGYSDKVNTCRIFSVPPRHCVTREVKRPPPSPDDYMRVMHVRAAGECEPLCPEWIAAEGVIMPDTPKLFRELMADLGGKKLPVFLNSPNGDFDAALEIGRMIREQGLTTAVGMTDFTGCKPGERACPRDKVPGQPVTGKFGRPGSCGHECLLILAGGKKRFAANASETFFGPPEGLASRRKQPAALVQAEAYLRDMQVSPELLRLAQTQNLGGALFVRAAQMMDFGLSSERSSPRFLTDPQFCIGKSPLPNCVSLAKPLKPPAPGREMFVVRMRASESCLTICPEWILAEGIITPDTPELFRKLLQEAGATKIPIALNSEGGDLDAALEIGRMIRARELDTFVAVATFDDCVPNEPGCSKRQPAMQPYKGILHAWGRCSGACLLIYAGGVHRLSAWAADSVFLSPKWFATRHTDTVGSALVEDYVSEMGISQDFLPFVRQRNGAVLGPDEMWRFRLTTDVNSPDIIIGPTVCEANPKPSHCVLRDKSS